MLLCALAACGSSSEPKPIASGSGSGSSGSAVAEPSPHERELMALWDFEKKRRAEIDFATQPSSDVALGPDPYRIVRAGPHRFGILRGDSAVVALDDHAKELARAPAPRSPSGLAVTPDGDALVVGEGARELAQYRFEGGKLERVATIPIDALGMRGIAFDGRVAYIVEEREGRLLEVALDRGDKGVLRARSAPRERWRCHGPVQVEAVDGAIAVNCLLDRTIAVQFQAGAPVRVQHDGPMWGFALQRQPDGSVVVAMGGVEDHPLERADGGFGYIDSYVYLYRVAAARADKLATFNVGERGLITPKWLAFRDTTLSVTGYGSAIGLAFKWSDRTFGREPAIDAFELLPGTTSIDVGTDGAMIAANPLFDAWVVKRGDDLKLVPLPTATKRTVGSRLGELLFFTQMMAPWSGTEGKRSRFTCETCHHEGFVDGRTHFTGREEHGVKVHATTRPLVGLFNNAPYFSRALDQTMTQMVHSEFKVANRHNGRDPWFDLTTRDIPWFARIDGAPQTLSAEMLRRAFIEFLADFTHRANPAADHPMFTAVERRGAETFHDRCASCHAARLIAEEPTTAVPFDRWEKLTLSPAGPIVWNNAEYAKTNVTPYVHEEGTRVPSLRRLYKKWPYFTSGAAKSLADLLERYAYDDNRTFHDNAPAGLKKLTADERAALLAFLSLL